MNLSVKHLSMEHVKHMLATAIVCSMLLVQPACHLPILRQPDLAPAVPTTFKGATDSENSGQLSIEEFFSDTLLTGMIEQGLANNRELKILEEEVNIARNEIMARQGAYLPFITAGANGGFDRFSQYSLPGAGLHDDPYLPGKLLPDPLPNTGIGLNLFWQLDPWRQLRNARDAAQQRFVAATEKRNYFVTKLVAEIAENYYRLMALDKRIENLDKTISLQQQSQKVAQEKLDAGKGTDLAVKRFLAEVRRNQSEKLIIRQEIIEVENRTNFLINRFPEPIERTSAGFLDLTIHALSVGVPSQLLQNRPDIRQAERELQAAGLDVLVARARFFPVVTLTGSVGFAAFNPMYIFTNPAEALVANLAGGLVAPLINKKAIRAEYLSANARQLEAVYNYQRTVLNAFTEVINRMSKVENYGNSIEIKKQQLAALEGSVDRASQLFLNARVEYVDVLLAQRDLLEARMVVIETKNQQLTAIVNAYQALGGGVYLKNGQFIPAAQGAIPQNGQFIPPAPAPAPAPK